MAIVLKKKTSISPGIIIFSHNEILRGVIKKSEKIQKILTLYSKKKEWLFGVHLQGDCSNVFDWPNKHLIDFFLWPEKNSSFFNKIDKQLICEMSCINFLDKKIYEFQNVQKKYDLICVSRFSKIKNIDISLDIIENLLVKNNDLKILIVLPKTKPKGFFNKEIFFFEKIDRKIRYLKSNKKYKNLEFVINETSKKGFFPLSESEIYKYISSSKYLMLNSYREGTPRTLIEAICLNTKVIISKKLEHGLKRYFNSENSLIYDETSNDIEQITDEILNNINNYSHLSVNPNLLKEFNEEFSKIRLVNFIKNLPRIADNEIEEINKECWLLHELKYRLASHFNKTNHQFINNEKNFLIWLDSVNKNKDYKDENYHYLFETDKKELALELNFFVKKLKNYIKKNYKL